MSIRSDLLRLLWPEASGLGGLATQTSETKRQKSKKIINEVPGMFAIEATTLQ